MSDHDNSGESGISQMPINRYELQAILLPGFILMSAITVALLAIKLDKTKLASTQILSFLSLSKENLALTIIFVLLYLLMSYILGHVLDALSSLLFERTMFTKFYGNPYEICINKHRNLTTFKYRPFLKSAVVIVFCLPLLYTVSEYNYTSRLFTKIITILLTTFSILLFLEFFIKQILLIQFKRNIILRRYFFLQKKYTVKILITIGAPFTILNNIFLQYFAIFTPLNKISIEKLNQRMKTYTNGESPHLLSTEMYWLAYWEVCNRSANMRAEINKFRYMANFFRSLSMSLYISTLCLLPCFKTEWAKDSINGSRFFLTYTNISHLIYLFLILSIIFFYKFILFHSFETKSVFRSLLVTSNK